MVFYVTIHKKVFSSKEELDLKLSQDVLLKIQSQKKFNMALPTGRSPQQFYQKLAMGINSKKLKLEGFNTFNLDEFIFENEEQKRFSYHNYMNKYLFQHISLNKKQIHFPEKDSNYDKLIENFGGLHLCLLGIGENGHVAFNEPGSNRDSNSRIIELVKQTRIQNAKMYKTDLDLIPKSAITMGLKTILKSHEIILIATGPGKKEILKRSLTGEINSSCPSKFFARTSSGFDLL